MGQRKHGKVDSQARIVQAKREEERPTGEKPSEALSRLSANVARPSDVRVLQKSVGNHAIQRFVQASGSLIQRSFRDDPDYRTWRERVLGSLGPLTQSVRETRSHHASEGTSLESAESHRASAARLWNEATVTGGGGTETISGNPAAEEGETATTSSE
jgi:hypothetical protein